MLRSLVRVWGEFDFNPGIFIPEEIRPSLTVSQNCSQVVWANSQTHPNRRQRKSAPLQRGVTLSHPAHVRPCVRQIPDGEWYHPSLPSRYASYVAHLLKWNHAVISTPCGRRHSPSTSATSPCCVDYINIVFQRRTRHPPAASADRY